MRSVRVIGAGLAGSEAAFQCARRGIAVELYEMRPAHPTPAHQTANFAELVCSNSLKSDTENSAPWLLKEEMRHAGSRLMRIAADTSVPAGHALAVDRDEFSRRVTEAIEREPLITVRREEVTKVEEGDGAPGQRSGTTQEGSRLPVTIIATGPLTSDGLSREIARLISKAQPSDAVSTQSADGSSAPSHLFFYDSISPIVEADSINMERVYLKARYDKGSADYINCPFTKEEYDAFYDAVVCAESVHAHEWENLTYFEGCLPIEEIARRGRDTLRFGPMKPVGLRDPRTGQTPYAVVQLRQENLRADSYNLVGFQNHLKFGDQARIMRMIPGLENAKFLRYGQIHRNTYINSPMLLTKTLQMKAYPGVLFAGQISGVEGYVESMATGLMAGIHAALLAAGERPGMGAAPLARGAALHEEAGADPFSFRGGCETVRPLAPPRSTALGSLMHYICHAEAKSFQPANITFDLLPPWGANPGEAKVRDKKERHRLQCERALRDFDQWLQGSSGQ